MTRLVQPRRHYQRVQNIVLSSLFHSATDTIAYPITANAEVTNFRTNSTLLINYKSTTDGRINFKNYYNNLKPVQIS